ncbi:AIR synthase family protein [Halorubrum vacuolatum]|uniref:Hydrogenase expression/formation protein HypE n=1 Tax=Halorubrum vacuolatum TaxID=63740 RepID=A0A238WU77_HALVU|nr:AIR synthase family protein [Halorubrum vacuolatum]SNR50097.1 hydrogenase expression/formation protein HypE [Halorubrum vacuolatum]
MTGKIDAAALRDLLSATGVDDPAVIQGAAYGEDAAAIDLGDQTLVVSTDPLSLAAEAVGRLAVHVACNDVAASGADPRWLTNTIFLPDDDRTTRETIATQVDRAAREASVAIVGGHTEVLPALERPLLSMTALGTTERFLRTGGASSGDRLLLTKGAAIEATAILATDFREACLDAGVSAETLDAAAAFLDEVSVIEDARALRDVASAMHDPTEGGLLSALVEMAAAGGHVLSVERERVPIRPETRTCCTAMDVDPLATFGSGALLVAVPEGRAEEALEALKSAGIDGAVIGEVQVPKEDEEPGTVVLDGETIREAPRDACYPLWA